MEKRATAVLGKNVRFLCGVKSISGIEITVEWFKYHTLRIVSSARVRITETDIRDSLLSTSDQRGHLKINGVRYSDAGLYTCKIKGNNDKLIASKTVYLTIKGKHVYWTFLLRNKKKNAPSALLNYISTRDFFKNTKEVLEKHEHELLIELNHAQGISFYFYYKMYRELRALVLMA